jgi:hypothetical protein
MQPDAVQAEKKPLGCRVILLGALKAQPLVLSPSIPTTSNPFGSTTPHPPIAPQPSWPHVCVNS